MNYIDLHTHTTASDGTDTPTQLVNNALSLPLSAIAITDHDTVDGVEEAIQAAKGTNLEVIAGIELSCQYHQKEIHMLGYFIDYKSEPLFHRLEQLKQARNLKYKALIKKPLLHAPTLHEHYKKKAILKQKKKPFKNTLETAVLVMY